MRPSGITLFALAVLVSLICVNQVEAAPVVDTWASGLIHRAKRSLLWRWNTLKPVGAGCRDNYECGTNYCSRNICTFQPKSSSS
ncbi:liver-expressed antimicrobial peptide 2-like isoform X1 [Ictalurus punctatus]|uniref:Liver-expressed antimicrobial peptide 2 n=1 Tax=Ictalurus punctatus TaxID=7998 RepID=A0A2D0SYB2_ICTPU|nr:liver-expressed antimicrobial peptide 2-like isoform X1 [Ictalurus punctatus]